ncbi:MAG: hypothetical protein IT379_32950, partial [Deltaproteobacteria bacterium]|nr:hypothetical protein [Deltaproteobacteria bacterium]
MTIRDGGSAPVWRVWGWVVIACMVSGCVAEQAPEETGAAVATLATGPAAGACPPGQIDACAGFDLSRLQDNQCYLPDLADMHPLVCSRHCVPADAPPSQRRCPLYVAGATQDQCPNAPGCCMRLSTRSGDMGAEGRICELAANVGGNCPAGADECGAASSVAGTTDTMCAAFLGQHFDVTCHSLGGAWCQCNGVHDAAFIGTQCPTDATGAPCRNLADRPGTCCVNNANPGATDPVQSCVDAFCGANIGIPIPIVPGIPAPVVPIPDSAGVAQCMYFAGQGNLDMHNAVDYQQCLGRGIVAPGVALPPSCGFAAGANVGPPLPGGPVTCTPNAATGGLDCACGPDVPYCGDNFTPCCAQTYGGRTDGCGPHQRCDRGLGPQGGPGMCVPVANDCSAFSPFDDWESSQIGNLGSLWEISDIIGNWTWIPGAAWPRCTMLGASEIIWNMNDIPGSWDISWNSQIGGGGGILKCSMDCPCGGEQNIYVRRNAAATCGWEMGYGQNGCNPCRPTETCGQILGGANLPPGGMDVCCNGPIAACLNNAGVPCDWVSRAPDG